MKRQSNRKGRRGRRSAGSSQRLPAEKQVASDKKNSKKAANDAKKNLPLFQKELNSTSKKLIKQYNRKYGIDIKFNIYMPGSKIHMMGCTLLTFACRSNAHISVIRHLVVDYSADCKATTETEKEHHGKKETTEATPLCFAVYRNTDKYELIKLLLEHGGDPNQVIQFDKQELDPTKIYVEAKRTLLDCVVGVPWLFPPNEPKTLEIIDFLMKKGVRVNEPDRKNGLTPLHRAISFKNLEHIKKLVDGGADLRILKDPNCHIQPSEQRYNYLMYAILHKSTPEIINFLCGCKNESGYRIDINQMLNGSSALALAVRFPDINVIKILLDKGANPDIYCESMKCTIREHIPMTRDDKIIKLFSGNELAPIRKASATEALMAAIYGAINWEERFDLLIEQGAQPDVEATSSDGVKITVLHRLVFAAHACGRSSLSFDMFHYLCSKFNDITYDLYSCDSRFTLISLSVTLELPQFTKFLLCKNGCHPNLPNRDSQLTPLQISIVLNRFDMFKLLISSEKVKVDRTYNGEDTALIIAVRNDLTIQAVQLLDRAANPNVTFGAEVSYGSDEAFKGEITPFYLAALRGNMALVEALVNKGANVATPADCIHILVICVVKRYINLLRYFIDKKIYEEVNVVINKENDFYLLDLAESLGFVEIAALLSRVVEGKQEKCESHSNQTRVKDLEDTNKDDFVESVTNQKEVMSAHSYLKSIGYSKDQIEALTKKSKKSMVCSSSLFSGKGKSDSGAILKVKLLGLEENFLQDHPKVIQVLNKSSHFVLVDKSLILQKRLDPISFMKIPLKIVKAKGANGIKDIRDIDLKLSIIFDQFSDKASVYPAPYELKDRRLNHRMLGVIIPSDDKRHQLIYFCKVISALHTKNNVNRLVGDTKVIRSNLLCNLAYSDVEKSSVSEISLKSSQKIMC